MRRISTYGVALVIAVVALGYALWGVDFAQLARVLSRGNYWVLPPYLALLVVSFALNAVRWALILRPMGRFRWHALVPSMMIGFAANNIFPARMGEFARAVLFARQFRQSVSATLMTLVLERVLDIVAILASYALAVVLIGSPPPAVRTASQVALIIVVASFAALALLAAMPRTVTWLWEACARWLPGALAAHGSAILRNTLASLGSLRSLRSIVGLLLLSLLRWAPVVWAVKLALVAYGIDAGLGLALLVFVVASLAVALPNTPGYIGTLQAAFVLALVPFGIDREVALASSVLFLVASWVPITATGLVFLLLRGLHVADLRHDLEASQAAGAEP